MSEASEISDRDFLSAVQACIPEGRIWAHGGDVADHLGVEWYVARKKFRRVYNRGLVTGCGCPCRGDWELTDKGRHLLWGVISE